ncbi:hypothetical protein EMIT0P176_10654 [Pseudomonas sp. IT-P176]
MFSGLEAIHGLNNRQNPIDSYYCAQLPYL